MKQIFIIASALIIFSACDQPASTNTVSAESSSMTRRNNTQSKEERNKQIAVNGVNGFINGDTSYLAETDPNCIDYNDGTMPPIKGIDSIRAIDTKMMSLWRAAFPDIKMKVVSATASSDTVMVWEEYTGTSKGDFMGEKPTGKSFDVYQVDYFIFNHDGKMIEHRMTPNFHEVAKQIGMKF